MSPDGILEAALYAVDLKKAESFYKDVLGLKVRERSENRHVFFQCGNVMLLIFNPEVTSQSGGIVPPHGTTGGGHVAFVIKPSEFEEWREHLSKNEISIEKEVDWEQGSHSIYFRDPAGNSIELTTFKTWGME